MNKQQVNVNLTEKKISPEVIRILSGGKIKEKLSHLELSLLLSHPPKERQLELEGQINTLAQTFDQWLSLDEKYLSKYGGSLSSLTLKKMSELAQTFGQWNSVCCRTPFHPAGEDFEKQITFAIQKMINLVQTHTQGLVAYEEARKYGFAEQKKLALQKILELAQTSEQWFTVCSTIFDYSNLIKTMLPKTEWTFDQWNDVCETQHGLSDYSDLGKFALQKMSELAQTYEQWITIHESSSKLTHHETQINLINLSLQKISEFERTFDQWNDSMLGELTEQKMVKTAQTFDQWLMIFERSSDKGRRKIAMQKMSGYKLTFEKWFALFKKKNTFKHLHGEKLDFSIKRNSDFNNFALQQMFELAQTFNQCILLRDWSVYPYIKKVSVPQKIELILQKMSKVAKSPENWLWLLEKTPKDSELNKLALQNIIKTK